MKKIMLFIITSILLTSAIVNVAVADEVNINQEIKTLTLYRYGPDGSVKPVKVDLDLEGKTLEDAVYEKCVQLNDNDSEIKEFINEIINNTNGSRLFSMVKSKGKGFHFKTKAPIRVNRIEFPRMPDEIPFLLKIKILLHYNINYNTPIKRNINMVFCNYQDDPNANTTVDPLLKPENETIYFEGSHSVFALNFVGYTAWLGHLSITPFDLFPRSFSGYATLVYCR